jgi:hypothetical protein
LNKTIRTTDMQQLGRQSSCGCALVVIVKKTGKHPIVASNELCHNWLT